jgi:uncharacterized cupredoxin-like copper-binding protein
MPTRRLIALSVLAVLVLAAASTLAIGAARRGFDTNNGTYRNAGQSTCTAPNLSGTVVTVSLTNMGGPMMGGAGMGGGVRGGMMRLTADAASVPHGTVSFVATNLGSINHEFVILTLPDNQIVGTRPQSGDGKVDETASIGEASNTCGSGAGDGIAPGASSWTTVTLSPGRYELVCNLPGHYAAGMYTQLTVR